MIHLKLLIHFWFHLSFQAFFMYHERPEKRFGQNWIKNWLCAWPTTWKISSNYTQVDQKYLSRGSTARETFFGQKWIENWFHAWLTTWKTSSNNTQVDQKYLSSVVRWEYWFHFNLVLPWKFFVLRIRKDKRKWKTFWGWIEWVLNLKVFPVDT